MSIYIYVCVCVCVCYGSKLVLDLIFITLDLSEIQATMFSCNEKLVLKTYVQSSVGIGARAAWREGTKTLHLSN